MVADGRMAGCIVHANVGDGEGFLRWKDGRIQPVTHAHKVSDAAELQRIRTIEERWVAHMCVSVHESHPVAVAAESPTRSVWWT